MGYSLLVTGGVNIKRMKTFLIVCLAALALAEPEAKADSDPVLLYGGYGYRHHLGYAGYPYTYGHYGKREAEAKSEADPLYLYGGLYGHHGYAGYPYTYGHYGYYGKREADANADPVLLYGGYGHHGYAGHYGYTGYPYVYYG